MADDDAFCPECRRQLVKDTTQPVTAYHGGEPEAGDVIVKYQCVNTDAHGHRLWFRRNMKTGMLTKA